MHTKKSQNNFSVVKILIDPNIISLARYQRKRGDLIEISKKAYGTPKHSNRVYYALLTGKAEEKLAAAIEEFYSQSLAV